MYKDRFMDSLGANYDHLRASFNELSWETILALFDAISRKKSIVLQRSVHVDLTLRCEAQCKHCMQWTWPTYDEMSIEEIRSLFNIFKKWGVRSLTFGGGEPLLHKNIVEVLSLTSEMGFSSGVVTSGSYIDKSIAMSIIAHCNWVRVSIDAGTKDVFDDIRGRGMFAKVLSFFSLINSQKGRENLEVVINCVVQKSNIYQLDGMLDLAKNLCVDVLLFKPSHGRGNYVPTGPQWSDFETWLKTKVDSVYSFKTNIANLLQMFQCEYSISGLASGFPVREHYISNNIRCFVPFLFSACSSDGHVFPCDYLQYDTRSWRVHDLHRKQFDLGEVIKDEKSFINKLKSLFFDSIHNFPRNGYEECGACTRFVQLNSALTRLYDLYLVDRQELENMLSQLDQNNRGIYF